MELEQKKTGAADINGYSALGKFFRAFFMDQMSARAGDLPMTDALQGRDNLNPKYDSQKQIYVQILQLLDGANSDITGLIAKGETTVEGDFYFAGDTSLTLDMQLIPRWIQTGFAILPIGDNYTMGYEDAAVAAEFVQTKKVIGMHYDTFPVIAIDHEAAKNAFSGKGIELLLPQIGETIEV